MTDTYKGFRGTEERIRKFLGAAKGGDTLLVDPDYFVNKTLGVRRADGTYEEVGSHCYLLPSSSSFSWRAPTDEELADLGFKPASKFQVGDRPTVAEYDRLPLGAQVSDSMDQTWRWTKTAEGWVNEEAHSLRLLPPEKLHSYSGMVIRYLPDSQPAPAGELVGLSPNPKDVEVGRVYYLKPRSPLATLREGHYRIASLSTGQISGSLFKVVGDSSDKLFEWYTITEAPADVQKLVDVVVAEAKATAQPTQGQLDESFDLGVADGKAQGLAEGLLQVEGARNKGRAEGADYVRGMLDGLGVDLVELDRLEAMAKAARLAYWEGIGIPRTSEPGPISIKGWAKAIKAGADTFNLGV